MSTKPGVTRRPAASISVRPGSVNSPTALITSPSTATSAGRLGAPVPSTTRPLRITRSCIETPGPVFRRALSRFCVRDTASYDGGLADAAGGLEGHVDQSAGLAADAPEHLGVPLR